MPPKSRPSTSSTKGRKSSTAAAAAVPDVRVDKTKARAPVQQKLGSGKLGKSDASSSGTGTQETEEEEEEPWNNMRRE